MNEKVQDKSEIIAMKKQDKVKVDGQKKKIVTKKDNVQAMKQIKKNKQV